MASYSRRDPRAFSLIEVAVSLLILALVLVAVLNMVSSSRRISASARRQLTVTLHAQTLLEGLAMLPPSDLPALTPGRSVVLLADSGASPAQGAGRFAEVARYFRVPPPFTMDRTITGELASTGELALRMDVEWLGIPGDERTAQRLTIPMLAAPPRW